MSEIHPSLCRLCLAFCPILVTVENGRAVKVTGDPDAPLYDGYTCPKGRALPEQHYAPSRLLHSLKRGQGGVHHRIATSEAVDEIAARVREIVDRHGPRSVALYFGTGVTPFMGVVSVAYAWLSALGSRMMFSVNTIDKPGMQIAQALHGTWQAGHPSFESADAWLLVGTNPVISKTGGFPPNNPGMRLKEAVNERGLKLVVIDPRVTEAARRAHIHLQCKPGEDPSILAGLINVIIAEKLYDADFVAENAEGFDVLAQHVSAFTPQRVAERASIERDKLIDAARVIARSKYCGAFCGTGPSFATHGSLTEYLMVCLTTLCGHWAREGQTLQKPNVLLPPYVGRAQALPPFAAWGGGESLRVRGLGANVSGLPAAALADEILLEGAGQIKALFCLAGNPMMAMPDQQRTFQALKSLELLVTNDLEMTATAKLSHYVIASKLTLETPGTTQILEALKYVGHSRGLDQPYARYAPKIVDPPAGSDVVEDWEFYFRLAQRMGLSLKIANVYGMGQHIEAPAEITSLNMENSPTTDELLELMHKASRVPLSEVKKYPHGHVFEEVQEAILSRSPSHTARLDLGNTIMMAELDEVLSESVPPGVAGDIQSDAYPFLLIPRRMNQFVNSHGRNNPKLAGSKPYNPAYMHPSDLERLGIASGEIVRIQSQHGEILGIAEADRSLRPGLVSMAHCFGVNPDEVQDPRKDGGSVARLLRADCEYDPITGIPRMGALPVAIAATA